MIFQENHVRISCDLSEAQILKKMRGGGLGIEKQMKIAPAVLHIGQMPHKLAQQSGALKIPIHRQAAQGIAGAGAGGHQTGRCKDTGGIIQPGVPPQPFPGQQRFHFSCLGRAQRPKFKVVHCILPNTSSAGRLLCGRLRIASI